MRDSPPWEWPKSAGRTFLKILTDRRANPEDRRVATELAGDFTVVNDDICNGLLGVLTDPAEDTELRATAAISFGAVLDQGWTFGFEDPDEVPIDEPTFLRIQAELKRLCLDPETPVLIRRRALEASVRAPEDWHPEFIANVYASGERDWVLTAVFAMRYVKGFEKQIVESLSNPDKDIHYEAVRAAGAQEVAAARDHVVELVEDSSTPKELLLAAIEAVGSIAPAEADEILGRLESSSDEDISGAADEAISGAALRLEMAREGDEDEDEVYFDDDEEEESPEWLQ
jgi:hypothetical protein